MVSLRIGTAALAAAALLSTPRAGVAQASDSAPAKTGPQITVTPGAYRAGPFTATLLGTGWRDLWTTPVTAPVLHLETYAGGLEFERRGGGRQSITAHFKREKGRDEYVFRSVDKFPGLSLPAELEGSLVGRIIQDQTSAFLPAAPLLVPPLLEAIGVLHIQPELMVMENGARLGKERTTFAGMLGTFEIKPKDGADGAPGFGGSREILDTDEFFEELAKGHNNRLDEREYLASRLVDYLINDTDRTPDNYNWARFGEKDDAYYTWRVIPRDRDWAFIDSRGLVNSFVISRMFPKFATFKPKARLRSFVYSSHELDRRLMQRLTAKDFHEVALRVQAAVTNPVIARVVDELQPQWETTTNAPHKLKEVMIARRDNVVEFASRFYRDLASEVDVRGTDVADRADVVRHSDGSVTVTLTPAKGQTIAVTPASTRDDGRVVTMSDGSIARTADNYYQRTFVPGETQEVRVYLGKGDDVAVARGDRNSAIRIRIIGEKGNDVLADSVGGGIDLYDSEGTNRLIASDDTRIVTKPWDPPSTTVGLRVGSAWRPDWGGKTGWTPVIDYASGADVIVGFGPRFKKYGFRSLPFQWQAGANLLYGTGNGRVGANGFFEYRAENSPMALTLDASATQLDGIRFFGYGNDSPSQPNSVVFADQRIASVEPALVWRLGWRARETDLNPLRGEDSTGNKPGRLRPTIGKLRVGPVVSWIDPEPALGAPLAAAGVIGGQSFTVGGAQLGLELDRTDDDAVPTAGWKFRAGAAGYPITEGIDGAFGMLSSAATAYVPIVEDGLHLAFRAGGAMSLGDAPVQFSPALGGRSSLRGFPWRRYTGDRAANAGAEVRLPVGRVNFILNSRVGVFALADAGRVWADGESAGGWHTGVGGGLWLSALGKSVSLAYAQGERGRLYVKTGLSY